MNPSIDLEAAQAAFFASGGQLAVLEGFAYRPLPERKHPDPKQKPAKPAARKAERQQVTKARTRAAKIAELPRP